MEYTKLLFSSIIFLFGIYLNASYDEDRIKNNKHIDHVVESVVRALVIVLFALIVSGKMFSVFYFILMFYFSCLFWLIFDFTLNKLRGLPWDYISPDNTEHSSFIDRIFKHHFNEEEIPEVMLGTKIVLFASSVILIIFYLHN